MALLESLSAACEVRAATEADLVDGVAPQVVARPASAEETSALLRACHADGLAVVVRGHGSKLSWGRPPQRLDVLLDTTAMDALVEHSRGDLIATAGAGMPLARLQSLLAEGGHQLVVDDLVAPRGRAGTAGSTLGGAVATNLAGPRRMWTGALRDLVIGVRLVRADGTIAKAGGKVVKNVAGYDLCKLLTGSYGTLAVITEVTVRLHPVPEAQRWVQVACPQEHLAAAVQHVVHSQLVPHALEIGTARPVGGLEPGLVLTTLLTGTEGGADARARTLAAELDRLLPGEGSAILHTAPDGWGSLTTPGRPVASTGGDGTGPEATGRADRATVLKTTARLTGIPELVAAIVDLGLEPTGSAGTGVLYALAAPGTDPDHLATAVDRLRAVSTRLGGSTVVLDAPAGVKERVHSWGPVPAIDLMRRVKDEFDPTRVLAPGRFVGGL